MAGIMALILAAAKGERVKLKNNRTVHVTSMTLEKTVVDEGLIDESNLEKIKQRVGKPLASMNQHELEYGAGPSLDRSDFLDSVAGIFSAYARRKRLNELAMFDREKGYHPEAKFWTDEEFVENFGEPPWVVLNQALEIIGLPYQFLPPAHGLQAATYSAPLVDTKRGLELPLGELSTGEQTLLALGLALYAGLDERSSVRLPRLLLLDEPDASLHPSMCKVMLRILQEVLVDTGNVRVVLTTHSPTTVAIAPATSLYIIDRDTSPRLQHGTVDACLRSLTVGLPTLSISTDNRIQVFVESHSDESVYTSVATAIGDGLNSDFSLQFIAVGHQHDGGDAEVKRIVGALRANGNRSVYGIVDRDTRKGALEGVCYSSNYYTLENIVLLPMCVGLWLHHNYKLEGMEGAPEGLPPYFRVNEEELQAISDFVVSRLRPVSDEKGVAAVSLAGGGCVDVPNWWLECNGHQLRSALLEEFAPLRSAQRTLMESIARRIWVDRPELVPVVLIDLFRQVTESAAAGRALT